MAPFALTRRALLRLSGLGVATAAGLAPRPSPAQAPVLRRGDLTNMWGMPTYYLLRSGHLEGEDDRRHPRLEPGAPAAVHGTRA